VTGSLSLLGLAGILHSGKASATSILHRRILSIGSLGLGILAVSRAFDLFPFERRNEA